VSNGVEIKKTDNKATIQCHMPHATDVSVYVSKQRIFQRMLR